MKSLHEEYKQGVAEDDRVGLATYSTLLKLLTKRGEVKTALSAYYFRFEYAKKVFALVMDRLIEMMGDVANELVEEEDDQDDKIAAMREQYLIMLGKNRALEMKDKFEQLSQFISYGYSKDHLDLESRVEGHCCRHAVNKNADHGRCSRQADHSHEDGKVCGQCYDLFTFFLPGSDVEDLIDGVANHAPQDDIEACTEASNFWDEIASMKRSLSYFQKEVVDYAAHHVRAKIQDAGIDEIYDGLLQDGSTAVLEFDHKQKFLPRWFREAQQLYFGKRGMSIGGFMLVRRLVKGGVVGLERVYIDVIIEHYSDQDHVQVSALMRIMLEEIKKRYPDLKEVYVKTDNASCMVSQDNIPYIWNLNKRFAEKYGEYKVKGWVSGEACTNKGYVDVHFAYTNIVISSYAEDGNDVKTEEDTYNALNFRGGMKGSSVILIDTKGLDGQSVNSKNITAKVELDLLIMCSGTMMASKYTVNPT